MAIGSTAIWRVRPSGDNLNGGGFDPGIAGAGTDYSQQNAAQVSGTNGTAAGTATFTDAVAANFTAAMVGNGVFILGAAGITQGWYFCVGYTSATTITLDRSPGTGTASWRLGGAWADPWTNTTTAGNISNSNIVYILGSGTPNPSSYTYDYTAPASVATPVGGVLFANDPGTPGFKLAPDTTGGMPVIKIAVNDELFGNCFNNRFQGLWFVQSAGSTADSGVFFDDGGSGASNVIFGCVYDQFGQDTVLSFGSFGIIGNEIFSSVVPGSAGSNFCIQVTSVANIVGNNIHDYVGHGIGFFNFAFGGSITENIIAKGPGLAIDVFIQNIGVNVCVFISNNTIDSNNAGISLDFASGQAYSTVIFNNILTNNTTGINWNGSLSNPNVNIFTLSDYNTYFGNSTDISGANYGPHDTVLGSSPYVNSTTENYALL